MSFGIQNSIRHRLLWYLRFTDGQFQSFLTQMTHDDLPDDANATSSQFGMETTIPLKHKTILTTNIKRIEVIAEQIETS